MIILKNDNTVYIYIYMNFKLRSMDSSSYIEFPDCILVAILKLVELLNVINLEG